MKALTLISAILLGFIFHSCGKCGCNMRCTIYNHDSIEICENVWHYDSIARLNDSLAAHYGPGHDTLRHISVNANSTQFNQLKQQGYQCDCPK